MRRIILLCLALLLLGTHAIAEETQNEEPLQMIQVTIGETVFDAYLEDNETAKAFADLLPMTLDMSELNRNEKYHYLMAPLPSAPEHIGAIEAGDLMLFGSDCVVLFYESFSTSYSYTRIGCLADTKGLREALGNKGISVTFSLAEDDERSH